MTTSCNVHAKTGCGHDHGGHLPAAPGWHSLRSSSHGQRRRREEPQEAGPQDWCLSAWLCKKATARLKRVQRNQTRKTTGGFRTQSPGFAPMTRSRIHHGLVTGESRARPAKPRCFHSSVLHRNAVVSVPQGNFTIGILFFTVGNCKSRLHRFRAGTTCALKPCTQDGEARTARCYMVGLALVSQLETPHHHVCASGMT